MNLFYDSVIFLYLVASTMLAVGLFRDRKRQGTWWSCHYIITTCASVLLCFSALVVAWGSFVEPRLITVKRVSIDLPNFEPTQPVRAALISDIQVGDYKKGGWTKKVVTRIKSLSPDLVLIAGDIIQRTADDAQYLSGFRPLSSVVRTYAVLGDHDYHVTYQPPFSIDEELADTVKQALTDTHVDVLSNEARMIDLGCRHSERSEESRANARPTSVGDPSASPQDDNCVFLLVGLDDWLARKINMGKALRSCVIASEAKQSTDEIATSPSAPRDDKLCDGPLITLVHNPDFILAPESKNADLILAGNTHGGQIRLPFIGPIGRWNSKLPRRFDEGLFTVHAHTRLFITSGLGESGPRARLFNPPEIVLLELY